MSHAVILESTITCPDCGRRQSEEMPVNACVHFYECRGCGRLLRPLATLPLIVSEAIEAWRAEASKRGVG